MGWTEFLLLSCCCFCLFFLSASDSASHSGFSVLSQPHIVYFLSVSVSCVLDTYLRIFLSFFLFLGPFSPLIDTLRLIRLNLYTVDLLSVYRNQYSNLCICVCEPRASCHDVMRNWAEQTMDSPKHTHAVKHTSTEVVVLRVAGAYRKVHPFRHSLHWIYCNKLL